MSDNTILTKVEKQMEGTNLALAAVAEVLQKMDARFSDEEDAMIRKAEEEEANADHTALVKEIATAVVRVIKSDNELGVDGTKVKSASGTGKSAGNADDGEKKVTTDSKTESVQATIQAMLKDDGEEGDGEDDDDDEMNYARKAADKEKDYPKPEAASEDDAEEFRKEGEGADEEELEDDEAPAMKEMRKRLDALKKQVASYEGGIEKMVKVESEDRLRKMGFREETSLTAPKRIDIGLGLDGTTRIQKAQSQEDVVDQLTQLSYKQLRDMQTAIEAGQTEGLPRELIQN